jgi:hypothetical protein
MSSTEGPILKQPQVKVETYTGESKIPLIINFILQTLSKYDKVNFTERSIAGLFKNKEMAYSAIETLLNDGSLEAQDEFLRLNAKLKERLSFQPITKETLTKSEATYLSALMVSGLLSDEFDREEYLSRAKEFFNRSALAYNELSANQFYDRVVGLGYTNSPSSRKYLINCY